MVQPKHRDRSKLCEAKKADGTLCNNYKAKQSVFCYAHRGKDTGIADHEMSSPPPLTQEKRTISSMSYRLYFGNLSLSGSSATPLEQPRDRLQASEQAKRIEKTFSVSMPPQPSFQALPRVGVAEPSARQDPQHSTAREEGSNVTRFRYTSARPLNHSRRYTPDTTTVQSLRELLSSAEAEVCQTEMGDQA
ncbi:hypothetical protein FH972_024316 [Carpinus fangiana]|uniref:Uncharacterized protein n=1 Tax=Carpinus fangiana TaxID=176857 RepID=A0A5N6KY52_9ROSI|nr:hypothetical protein FH972_024316 [Carpinus fangiana]